MNRVVPMRAAAASPLARLSRDTLVYGTSTVISRFLTFLLVPYYTNVLRPAEYGIVGTTYTYLTFLAILYAFGMEAAYFRFAADAEGDEARVVFSTPFLALCTVSAALTLALAIAPDPAAAAVNRYGAVAMPAMREAVRYCALVLFFDTICLVPFAALRMQHRAVRFAGIKLVNVTLQVGLNLVFLTVLRTGFQGIFLGNALAGAVTLLLLLPVMRQAVPPAFSRVRFREMLRFGLPYLPSGIALMMLQVIDRPILQALTDDAHVGIYQANYRLGIVMMVFVSMFEYAWRPFFLQYAAQPNARRVFALVLTVFAAVAGAILLAVGFFVGDLARLSLFGRTIINHQYWGGLHIVPVVLAAYVFNGFYTNFIAGVYIEKRMAVLPWVTGAGAVSNIVANLLLIPSYGIDGAAWATFLSYALMAGLLYAVARRFYVVPYEWGRVALVLGATAALFALGALVAAPAESPSAFWVRLGLLGIYAGVAWATVAPRRFRSLLAAESSGA